MQVKLCSMHFMVVRCCKCCEVWKHSVAFLLRPLLKVLVVVLQIFEGVVNLLDRLKAWHSTPGSPGNTELKEMAQIGLRIITGYIQQQRSPVSCTHNLSSPVHLSNHKCQKFLTVFHIPNTSGIKLYTYIGSLMQYFFNLVSSLK